MVKQKKSKKVGGKVLNFKNGYLKTGILYDGEVYPIFSSTQEDSSRTWRFVNSFKRTQLLGPPKTKNEIIETYKKLIINSEDNVRYKRNNAEKEEARVGWIELNLERGIPREVSIEAYELANNEKADDNKPIKHLGKKGDLDFHNFNNLDSIFFKTINTDSIIDLDGKSNTNIKVPINTDLTKDLNKLVEQKNIKQPNNMEEYLEMLDKNKILPKEDIVIIRKDGLTSYLGGLLDNIASATGLKVGVKKLINNFANTAMLMKGLITLNNLVRGRPGGLRAIDVIPINMWNVFFQSFRDLKKQKKLPIIKDKEQEETILLDNNLGNKIELYLEDVKNLGSGSADVDGGLRGNTLKGLYKKHFLGVDDGLIENKLIEKQNQRKLEDESMVEAIEDTPPKTKGLRDTFGEGDPSKANNENNEGDGGGGDGNKKLKMTIRPKPREKIIEPKILESQEEIQEQIKEQLNINEGVGGFSYRDSKKDSELDQDDLEDIGLHSESIQRISTLNNYDFTFIKNSLLKVNPLPNDKTILKNMGERCIREYGFLLNILKPLDNYSKKEVGELYTLKHILKQVIRLDVQYKRSILKMRVGNNNNQEMPGNNNNNNNNNLNNLMENGQLGLILNAESLNISPQDAINKLSKSSLKPPQEKEKEKEEKKQEQEGITWFRPKRIKKNRMKVGYQKKSNKPKKAKFSKSDKIIIKSRIDVPPNYQLLRTEASRLNENPAPLVFNTNNQTKNILRFNVKY